jgi:hypothetical protein
VRRKIAISESIFLRLERVGAASAGRSQSPTRSSCVWSVAAHLPQEDPEAAPSSTASRAIHRRDLATALQASSRHCRVVLTNAALLSRPDPAEYGADAVTSRGQLRAQGWTESAIRAQLDARRWQRAGRAIIRHNGPASPDQIRRAALITAGQRSLLTSFTGLEVAGLSGWSRDGVDVLVPRSARRHPADDLPVRLHYTDRWSHAWATRRGVAQAPVEAVLVAASSLSSSRAACGIIAALVQQRLARADDLVSAIGTRRQLRHHRLLLASSHDIGMGAQALSEIDFFGLCRRAGLPEPIRQAVRVQPDGRRRYLDAEWRTRGGRRLVVEVDGALHLIVRNWWDDQLRQNELVIGGDLVLRFPSPLVRGEEPLVADQLRRMISA